MTSISFYNFFIIFFLFKNVSSQHCHFEYNSYHSGEENRESRHNFTLKVAQNCDIGGFKIDLLIDMSVHEKDLFDFEMMVQRYLTKLSEKRLDDKTFVDFEEISATTVEVEGKNHTKISIAGVCEGDVKNWQTRCQVNVVFLMESFRRKDLIKFTKVEEDEEEDFELTLGELKFELIDFC